MNDKDTKLLSEQYTKILERRYSTTTEELVLPVSLTRGDDIFEDVPMNVTFKIYQGTTPPGGPDPSTNEITSIDVSDEIGNEYKEVGLEAGKSLEELATIGFTMLDFDGLQLAVDEYVQFDR
jgi:hypothetical protein